MEVGCPRHPGASTIGSELLDEDWSHGWQILAPMWKGEKQAPITLITAVERERGIGEGKEPLRRAPMLETLTLMENADSMQNYYNASWSKNMWNPTTHTDLNLFVRNGNT